MLADLPGRHNGHHRLPCRADATRTGHFKGTLDCRRTAGKSCRSAFEPSWTTTIPEDISEAVIGEVRYLLTVQPRLTGMQSDPQRDSLSLLMNVVLKP
ncbi:hypothetical protein ACIA2T_34305 [Amycolatopsis japonica]|uniref:hypothetical protein n=1 Tax=Amycolatopsis japonica TaxID=208439 RepID=UPI0037ADBF58